MIIYLILVYQSRKQKHNKTQVKNEIIFSSILSLLVLLVVLGGDRRVFICRAVLVSPQTDYNIHKIKTNKFEKYFNTKFVFIL